MSPTTEAKVSPVELKLVLALINSTKLPSIPWATVASGLDCNSKAAQERWRRFKIKLQGDGSKPVTAAEVDLILAIVTAVQLTGIDWGVVSQDLGINNKAAQERWRRFKLKLPVKVEGEDDGHTAISGAVKKGGKGKAATKDVNGGGAKKPGAAVKKRKLEEESDEEGSGDAAIEGGPVGGVNGSAKKRIRAEDTPASPEDSVEVFKGESGEDGGDGEGEGPEREDDEFYETREEAYGEEEGPEYEI